MRSWGWESTPQSGDLEQILFQVHVSLLSLIALMCFPLQVSPSGCKISAILKKRAGRGWSGARGGAWNNSVLQCWGKKTTTKGKNALLVIFSLQRRGTPVLWSRGMKAGSKLAFVSGICFLQLLSKSTHLAKPPGF